MYYDYEAQIDDYEDYVDDSLDWTCQQCRFFDASTPTSCCRAKFEMTYWGTTVNAIADALDPICPRFAERISPLAVHVGEEPF
jgi:hypothetical protein